MRRVSFTLSTRHLFVDAPLLAMLDKQAAMAMIRKGQIQGIEQDNVTGQIAFIHTLFGIPA